MIWRVLLTVFYGVLLGALMALENSRPDVPDLVWLLAWLAAPVVGFLVGRWWVVFAVVGAVFVRAIGWDSGENDGNPALWPPYVITEVVLIGVPLLAGVACSFLRRQRHRPSVEPSG